MNIFPRLLELRKKVTPMARSVGPFFLLFAALFPSVALRGQSDYAAPRTFTTLAGKVGAQGLVNGTGTSAWFATPRGIAVDGNGNVYVADEENNCIREVTPAGVVTTFVGQDSFANTLPVGSLVRLAGFFPIALGIDSAGNLYVSDGNFIWKVTSTGTVSYLAGGSGTAGSDGSGPAAGFDLIQGLAVDSTGNIYVADGGDDTIRVVTPGGSVTTLAGLTGQFGVVDGTGDKANFDGPVGVTLDGKGNLYVADAAIRKVVISTGVVTTIAGGPDDEGSADGTGSAAQFDSMEGIAMDSAGNLYVTVANNTIRKITTAGAVTTVAGTPGTTGSADGAGAAAQFSRPWGIAVDGSGDIFVADSLNYTIRESYAAANTAPALTTQPENQSASIGGAATFSASATGVPVPQYQWQFDGSNIRGATNPTLAVTNVQATNLGTYTLTVTNSVGSVVSNSVTLSSPGVSPVAPVPAAPRLINISTRAFVGTGSSVTIAGFVISGPAGATEEVLVRGIGPSLANFGINGALATPVLTIFDSSGTPIASSPSFWDYTDVTPAEFATGAFPLPYDTADTALVLTLAPGNYTAEVAGAAASTGVALAEVYEVASNNAQLENISSRCYIGTGSSIGIAGFIISGSGSKQVLIRGVGPTLAGLGVNGTLAQPVLTLLNSAGTQIATNTGWGANSNAAQVGAAFTATGAFALPSGSADSALLLTLPPGSYTAEVSGLNGTTGNALIEVYAVPN